MCQSFLHVKVPSLESLYIEDGRVPDFGRDYTHVTRPRRHLWSAKEKQVLYILNRHYENGFDDLWKVFNAFFADKFRRSPGPRRRSWESMRNHSVHPGRYHIWWTLPETRRLQAKLEKTASNIGIGLRAGARSHVKVSASTPRKRRCTSSPSVGSESCNSGWNSDEFETDDEDILRTCMNPRPYDNSWTPRASVKGADRGIGLLTPPCTRKRARSRSTPTLVPPIAFRGRSLPIRTDLANVHQAFNPQSQGLNGIDGFVAGSFAGVDPANIPRPLDEDLYLQDLERHLGRSHRGATPFISVSQNLLRVLVHAIRHSRQAGKKSKTGWSIAVISLSRISSSVRAVWDLDAGIHSRWAFGEWVVYGSIPSSNVLCVVSVDKLLRLMSRVSAPFYVDVIKKANNTRGARKAMLSKVNRTLKHDDGFMFGCLLLSLGIPQRHVDHVCTSILGDWRFPGYRTWLSNKVFVQGLSDSYQQMPRGFKNIAVNTKHEDSLSTKPTCDTGATVQTHYKGHEWLAGFWTELEEAVFGVECPDQTASDGKRKTITGFTDARSTYFKSESIDY